MITKALIIDEPWLSKILNGDKTWEMRSTQCKFRGAFGLIRKGSGLVVGVANLTEVSGPYNNAELAAHFDRHHVGDDLIALPTYKWRYAWELSSVQALEPPVRYQHKNGAVTWVELDDDAVEAISIQTNQRLERVVGPKIRELDPVTFRPAVTSKEDGIDLPVRHVDNMNYSVPKAKDGSVFSINTCNSKGIYTVGDKGDEHKFRNFMDALSYLKNMDKAKWRRPNENGNWGIVSAVEWVSSQIE